MPLVGPLVRAARGASERGREIADLDFGGAGDNAGTAQGVFQFADVARPIVGEQDLEGVVGDGFFAARFAADALQKMRDQ